MDLPKDWELVNKDGDIYIYKGNVIVHFDLKRNVYKVTAGTNNSIFITPDIHNAINSVLRGFEWIQE